MPASSLPALVGAPPNSDPPVWARTRCLWPSLLVLMRCTRRAGARPSGTAPKDAVLQCTSGLAAPRTSSGRVQSAQRPDTKGTSTPPHRSGLTCSRTWARATHHPTEKARQACCRSTAPELRSSSSNGATHHAVCLEEVGERQETERWIPCPGQHRREAKS
jgi:hypothetical protein